MPIWGSRLSVCLRVGRRSPLLHPGTLAWPFTIPQRFSYSRRGSPSSWLRPQDCTPRTTMPRYMYFTQDVMLQYSIQVQLATRMCLCLSRTITSWYPRLHVATAGLIYIVVTVIFMSYVLDAHTVYRSVVTFFLTPKHMGNYPPENENCQVDVMKIYRLIPTRNKLNARAR